MDFRLYKKLDEYDDVCPKDQSEEAWKEIETNARIIYLNCGHYIHYYESERINREIRAFVNQTIG